MSFQRRLNVQWGHLIISAQLKKKAHNRLKAWQIKQKSLVFYKIDEPLYEWAGNLKVSVEFASQLYSMIINKIDQQKWKSPMDMGDLITLKTTNMNSTCQNNGWSEKFTGVFHIFIKPGLKPAAWF